MKKIVLVNLFIFGLIFFSGCLNSKVKEIEHKEIVSFPIEFYSEALSSVPGQPIQLNLEVSKFTCRITNGSFSFNEEIKEITVNSGETIFYCPQYKTADGFIFAKEVGYVDIIVYNEEKIIGYIVVKISYIEDMNVWEPELCVSNLFVGDDGNYIDVSLSYVKKRINKYH